MQEMTQTHQQWVGRIGFELPSTQWPTEDVIGPIETAGFQWLELTAPPAQMLASPRHAVRHGKDLAKLLAHSSLAPVVRAPEGLRIGGPFQDRAFEGLLEYASQIGARHVVYHALDVVRRGRDSAAEELALARVADWAEALGITICLENLCPRYPGGLHVGHDPLSLRDLIKRLGSPAVAMSFSLGHANVVADFMRTDLSALLEPVLSCVALFGMHDNFGARFSGPQPPGVDPLLLDLHLPPHRGCIDWAKVASLVAVSEAPLVVEVDAGYGHAPAALFDAASRTLSLRSRPIGRHLVHAA